jgi:hypothetical protein
MKALIVTPIPAVETIGGGTWGILQLQVGFQIEVNMYFPATVDSKPHNSGICSAALGMFPWDFPSIFPGLVVQEQV